MYYFVTQARDLALLDLAGLSLFRLIVKARERSRFAGLDSASRKNIWHAGSDETAIEYDASWTGIFPTSKR